MIQTSNPYTVHFPAVSIFDVHFKWNCQFHKKDRLLNSINEDKIRTLVSDDNIW